MHVRFPSTLMCLYVLAGRAIPDRLLDIHFDFRDGIRGDVVVAVVVRYLQDGYGTFDDSLRYLVMVGDEQVMSR